MSGYLRKKEQRHGQGQAMAAKEHVTVLVIIAFLESVVNAVYATNLLITILTSLRYASRLGVSHSVLHPSNHGPSYDFNGFPPTDRLYVPFHSSIGGYIHFLLGRSSVYYDLSHGSNDHTVLLVSVIALALTLASATWFKSVMSPIIAVQCKE
jgi:hypothetical protein